VPALLKQVGETAATSLQSDRSVSPTDEHLSSGLAGTRPSHPAMRYVARQWNVCALACGSALLAAAAVLAYQMVNRSATTHDAGANVPPGAGTASAGRFETSVLTLGPRNMAPGHENAVWSVAFSPDGTKLISAGVDKTIKLRDPLRRSSNTKSPRTTRRFVS